jgi:hypothetical protein
MEAVERIPAEKLSTMPNNLTTAEHGSEGADRILRRNMSKRSGREGDLSLGIIGTGSCRI